MNFIVSKIILWPRNKDFKIREIVFSADKVNVITGGSGRGKSAIISIIDYCLASTKIRIPTGLIRDTTEWFGILIQCTNRQILLARNLNGKTKELSNEMFKLEGPTVEIPAQPEPAFHAEDIRLMLNKLLDYSDIDVDPNARELSFSAQRPSYRNAISLNFQPQYIVANPSTLFYKADSTADREKLRIIFPYLLGAIDNNTLELKEELKLIRKELYLLEKELREREDAVQKNTSELKTYFNLAKEFGLIDKLPASEDLNKDDIKGYLKEVQSRFKDNNIPFIPVGITENIASRVIEIREKEYELTLQLSALRRRLISLKELNKTTVEYRSSISLQSQRTRTVDWFKQAITGVEVCPFCGSNHQSSADYVNNINTISSNLGQLGERIEDSVKVYSAEIVKTQNRIMLSETELNKFRVEIVELEEKDREFKRSRQALTNIFRFLGRVDQVLESVDIDEVRMDLHEKIKAKRDRIGEIEDLTKDDRSEEKKKNALDKITENIRVYANVLQPEKLDSRIALDIENLTVRFISGEGASDFLWEIGRNFMAYHISTLLAVHEYLDSLKQSKVPNFLIFDQPSQVYFPEISDDKKEFNQEDIAELKKIFEVLNLFIERTKGRVQIILLEHAGEDSWKDFRNIRKVYRWRDEEADRALIPDEWY
jgi:hypothetical protein